MPSVAQSAQVCYPGRFKHLPLSPHAPAQDHLLSLPAQLYLAALRGKKQD